MTDGVCTEEDDFTRERWLSFARWTVLLSDDTKVIQDDGRPGLAEPSAWLRLREHVGRRGLAIVSMWLQFRGEPPVRLPDRAEGYFFRRSVGAILDSDLTFDFYMAGYLQNSKVVVHRIKVPEMLLLETELREPADPETVGPSLIRNPQRRP